MRVLILGGGGFLGVKLAEELLSNGGLVKGKVSELELFDNDFQRPIVKDPRVTTTKGDFSDPVTIRKSLDARPEVIFHLAAIVSGEAEKNLALGMHINLHASLKLLEICREMEYCPTLVFASSCAVFGGDVSETIIDNTAPKPRSSYGTQKAIVELLINDYSRRGFVDGRSLRLPTIAIRPGKANAATSSFVSGIIREPLNGQKSSYPVPPETEVWIQSPKNVTANFIHAANIEKSNLGDDRIITLGGLTTSIQQMLDCLQNIAGKDTSDLVEWIPDAFLESIVLTWPPHFQTDRSDQLGFVKDKDIDEIINAYIKEEGLLQFIK